MSATRPLPDSLGESSEAPFARTITAIDLSGKPELRGLWFPGPGLPAEPTAPAGLPAGGRPSPLGYWLVEQDGLAPPASTGLRLVITAAGEGPVGVAVQPAQSRRTGRRFRTQTVKLKAPGPGTGDIVLTIGPDSAQVIAEKAVWEALSEPILLAVCQVWRFQAIELELEGLTESALENLSHANAPGLASLSESRRLTDLGRRARTAIVDLTYFQTPLTDPSAYFDSRRSARSFRLLAQRLGLDDWSDSIDHRAEVVEGTFETITEKLYYLQSHAHDVVLEVIIAIFLLIDILMRIWEVVI